MANQLIQAGGAIPANVSERDRAEKIVQLYHRARAPHDAWAKEAAADEDFFYGKQWTPEQVAKLERRGMAPLVINRVMPVILQEVAIFTSKDPQYRALPRGDGDVQTAAVWSDVLAYIYYISNGQSEILQAAQDYFTVGCGYLHGFIDPLLDDGRGEVLMESLPPWDVLPDPNSRKIDLSDARYIMISRVVDRDSLMMTYPHKRKAIMAAVCTEAGMSNSEKPHSGLTGDSQIAFSAMDVSDPEVDPVRLYVTYEKLMVPHVELTDGFYGEKVVVPQSDYTGIFDDNDRFSINRFYRVRIRKTVSIGNNVILENVVLPIDTYPVVPLFLHHNRTPFPKGDVAVVKGLQIEINKRRSLMIHNAALLGNMRMTAEKGSISNETEWFDEGTNPGFVLYYKKGFAKPEPMITQPLPNAWIQLENEAKGDLEFAVSVFAAQMGSSVDAPETYRALLALEEAGQRKIRHKMAHAQTAMKQLGRVCLQLSQALYTVPKVMRIVGEDGELREVFANQMRADILTGRISKINDLTVGQYDLVVEAGTSMPTNRMALLNLYMELFQLGIVDQEEVLKKTDVVDRQAVLQRIGHVAQMNQQLAFMQERSKDLEGLNQTLRRQLQQAGVKLQVQMGSEGAKDQLRQTTAEQKLARARIADSVKMFQNKLDLTQKKIELDGREIVQQAKLDAMKQRALMEVERARISAAAARRPSGSQ